MIFLLKIKNLYHSILIRNPKLFALIYAIFFSVFFTRKISKKKNPKKKILLLNKIRFWKDITVVNRSQNLEFFYFEQDKMSLLTEPFVKTIRKKIKLQSKISYWYDFKDEKFFLLYLKSHSEFIFFFLKYYNFLNKFDFLVSPSLWYLPDQAFEKAANLLNKNFIFLHKENSSQDTNIEKQSKILEKRFRNFGSLSKIIVYNKNTKKIINKTKKINSKNIFVLGCPRIDEYIKFKPNNPKKITLSSFRYDLSLNYFKAYDRTKHPFETNDKNLIFFFNKIHSLFIDLAIKNTDQQFIIKIKYANIWKKLLLDLKIKKEKKLNYPINNLEIIANELDMSEILKETKLLIGINSLSLVEARILGIPCIVPNFKIIKDYQKHLFFKNYFKNELIEVTDEKEFKMKADYFIKNNFEKRITKFNKSLIKEFFGYNDGKNTKRNINFLENS